MIVLHWLAFLIDLPSLADWLATNYADGFVEIRATSTLAIRFHEPLTSDQIAAIKTHLGTLAGDTEATKRALKSRLRGALGKNQERFDFELAVKNFIATKDWSAMSVAERKFSMGGTLTNSEYDTLTTS